MKKLLLFGVVAAVPSFAVVLGAGLVLIACGSRERVVENMLPNAFGEPEKIDVFISETAPVRFSDLMEDVVFVPIENDSTNLIGGIDKITIHNGDYYVLDRHRTGNLWRIDSRGRFLNRIGRVGRGPGEYGEPTDFMVDSTGVTILDQYSRGLLFYDLDGTYRNTVPLDYIAHEITDMGGGAIFAVAGDNRQDKEVVESEFMILDKQGELLSQGLKNKNRMNYIAGYKSFRRGDEVVYFRPMHGVVYGVTQDSIRSRFRINIEDSPLPANYEKICGGDYVDFMEKFEGKYSYFSGRFAETDDYILFFTTSPKHPNIWTIYRKDTGNTVSSPVAFDSSQGKMTVGDMIMMFGLVNYTGCSGDEIVGFLESHYLAADIFTSSDPALKDVTESGNPVIFRFKIKDLDEAAGVSR